jgi:hypothetical protein
MNDALGDLAFSGRQLLVTFAILNCILILFVGFFMGRLLVCLRVSSLMCYLGYFVNCCLVCWSVYLSVYCLDCVLVYY